MATDILLGGDDGDTIVLDAKKLKVKGSVEISGRMKLPIHKAATPPREGEIGDLVLTLEEGQGFGGMTWSKAHLWLCVPSEGSTEAQGTGVTRWREVQLGEVVVGG